MTSRREFLVRFGAVAGAAMAGSAAPAPAGGLEGRRPNVVLVLTDDQGLGDMGWTGHPHIRTPRLDALREQALWFSQFQVSPTCAPTRCALMTGRHEFYSGVTHTIFERERMSLSALTLPQALKSAGYATGIFGKWHLGDEDPYQPGQRGFDEVLIHGGGGIGQTYPGSCGDAPNNDYFDPVLRHNGRFERTKGYCTDVFFDRALHWIDARRKTGEPFFCYVPTNAPHEPCRAPDQWRQPYVEKGLGERESGFCGMVANIDWNVGRLLDRLEEWGLSENTLVLFLGDNGTAQPKLFGGGLRGGKGTAHEGGTRVGLLARWKGVTPDGAESAALTAHLDLFPTLCALAGASLPPEKRLDGRSLLPLLRSPAAPWPDRLLFTHVGRWSPGADPDGAKYRACAVRTSRFRLVDHAQLYDLSADAAERTDVSAQHPDEVARLRQAYDAWWADVRPHLENERPVNVPAQNPFKTAYWSQFGF